LSLPTALAALPVLVGAIVLGQALILFIESRRHRAYRLPRAAQRARRRAVLRALIGLTFIALGIALMLFRDLVGR
jgi:hypothetical protein